ncbi:MAG: methyltransferase domain-containing protein, partial [Burkholderiales bacterium]
MVVVTSNQREIIFDAVQAMYTAVATTPDQEFHFPTGRRACEYVGYPAAQLDAIPPGAVESFAGVGYPFAADVIRVGDRVLDVGAGSGTDT